MKTIEIKPLYNSLQNKILEEFYIPVLSKTKIYKRVSAYFDSKIISLYSKGIENIIKQRGHIYFIFSSELNENDYNIIKNGYKKRDKIFDTIKNNLDFNKEDSNIKNLAFLIQNNYVDIKIAFKKSGGIFHDKFGLCQNNENIIYFRGSNNETVASINSNFESFETTCSWNSNESEQIKIKNATKLFDNLWNNKFQKDLFVIDMPDVIKNHLISYSENKIIPNDNFYNNSVLFDYEESLIIVNNLYNKEILNPKYSLYKNYFDFFVHEIKNDKIIFKKNLDYTQIIKIIEATKKYSIDYDFEVITSINLDSFLHKHNIRVKERHSLGIAIKKRNEVVTERFNYFSEIVNREMARQLRMPQMWDSFHISEMKRSANFSVPGSGKTSIVLGAFSFLLKEEKINKVIVIGPINSFSSWVIEFKKCFGNKKKLILFNCQKEKKYIISKKILNAKKSNLLLFNYESLKNNEKLLLNIIDNKSLLVFDEVHRVKSVNGIRAEISKKIAKNATYRVVLTGTPIPNGYIDLFNMLNILFNEEYRSFFGFAENFLTCANNNENYQRTINEKIYPFFCRTTKEELLVPKAEPDKLIYCNATEEENLIFKAIYKAFKKNKLLLYIRLIQASNNPKLVLKQISKEELTMMSDDESFDDFSSLFENKNFLRKKDIELINKSNMTTKFYEGINLVEQLSKKGKVIVWGIFIDTLNEIKKALLTKNIKSEIIYGNTNIDEREIIINSFKNDDLLVLITNPQTLGESISLHDTCHQAVYFEFSFNLVHLLQSKDRIHRLGLKEKDKTNYYFLCLNSFSEQDYPIDYKIYNRLKEKEKLQEEALSGEDINYVEENINDDVIKLFGEIK